MANGKTFLRSDAIREIKRELNMRLLVWSTIDKIKFKFVNYEKQKRFDVLLDLLKRIEILTDRDWYEITKRLEKIEEMKKMQKTLF